MKENWRTIPGYSLYQVSDLGRVKSFVKYEEGRILRPGTMNRFGHCSVALGRGHSKCVHALVLLAFVGPRPTGHDCLHRNGVGSDNRLRNLRYGTRSENNVDSTKMGRKGKMTEAMVRSFRKRYAKGETGMALASEAGMQYPSMYKILNGGTYAWVK